VYALSQSHGRSAWARHNPERPPGPTATRMSASQVPVTALLRVSTPLADSVSGSGRSKAREASANAIIATGHAVAPVGQGDRALARALAEASSTGLWEAASVTTPAPQAATELATPTGSSPRLHVPLPPVPPGYSATFLELSAPAGSAGTAATAVPLLVLLLRQQAVEDV